MHVRLAAILVLVSLLQAGSPAHAASSCSRSVQAALNSCPSVNSNGTSLTVTATQQQPGTDTNIDPGPRGGGGPGPGSQTEPQGPSDEAIELAACMDDSGTTRCARRANQPAPPASTPTAPPKPAITITDLARFAPESALAATEPGNVGIAGMPANFVAAASVQVQSGTLFGAPLRVRFTPAGYDYTYGDGSSATLTESGQTWAALGQAQFTPTATSHIYRTSGTFLADVDVRYTAEIDLGGGWEPVTGQLTTDGQPQEIRIYDARTALVAHTCEEDPAGIGC